MPANTIQNLYNRSTKKVITKRNEFLLNKNETWNRLEITSDAINGGYRDKLVNLHRQG